jgi:hypothetical protein
MTGDISENIRHAVVPGFVCGVGKVGGAISRKSPSHEFENYGKRATW